MTKKQIGIITYFYFYNYGTMLQAFALQYILNKIDYTHEVDIIDYRFGEKVIVPKWKLLLIRLRSVLFCFIDFNRLLTLVLYKNRMGIRKRKFDLFITQKCNLSTNKYLYYSDLENNHPKYDVYVTGSDQTWSPKIGFNPALFLDFADIDAAKVAYAPSVGVTSFNDEEKAYLKEHLEKYSHISCRETIGANLLEEITGREVEIVLDPTLMMKAEEWRRIAVNPKIDEPYILCYFLGHRKYYRDYVTQLSKQTGYKVYYIPVSYVDCKKSNSLLLDAGPLEFIGLIDNAAIVCTDSFHGIAFCTNLNKTFYAFVKHEGDVKGGDNSRIYDYLKRVELTSRLISVYDRGVIEHSDIDYKAVNLILDKERFSSLSFLEEIIK